MSTKTQVSIQTTNNTAFKKHKVFVTADPAFDIGGNSDFILEGKIRSISMGINGNMGTAVLEFPNRPFGSHPGFVIPIAMYVDNSDNMVFRGFATDENAIIDNSNDQVGSMCYDYRWLINKLTKIRGKIYTVDNGIFPDAVTGGFSRVFEDPSMYQRFRYAIPGDPTEFGGRRKDGTGYLGAVRTVFNENGEADCASLNPNQYAVFKMDPDIDFLTGTKILRRRNERYFWNFATSIFYVYWHYIGNIFRGTFGTTKIDINYTGLYNIIRFGQTEGMELISPLHLDINNESPLEAIDKLVKMIPGTWYWRLLFFPKSVMIDIQCASEDYLKLPAKRLFLGDGGKINDTTNNDVNLASCKVTTSAKNAISHAVAVGGAIELETSIEYIPAWPLYLRPVSDLSTKESITEFDPDVNDDSLWDGTSVDSGYYLCDFKGYEDYKKYKQFIHGDLKSKDATSSKLREEITTDDEKRYAMIYRVFVFPENRNQITRFPDVFISDFLSGYQNYATYLDELFFKNVLKVRKVKDPITDYKNLFRYAAINRPYSYQNLQRENRNKSNRNPPFVFLHDSQISTVGRAESGNVSASDKADMLRIRKWIIPEEEQGNHYSFEQDNKILTFEKPQFERKTVSFARLEDTQFPRFVDIDSSGDFVPISRRKVFVTCRIECDVPLVKDRIANLEFYSGAKLVGQDIVNKDEKMDATVVFRVNAIFPNPEFNIGDEIAYETGETEEDLNGSLSVSATSSNFLGSKLIDANSLSTRKDVNVVVNDSRTLDQTLSRIIDKRPIYEQNLEADLGKLDLSLWVGDRIDRIVRSELADGTGGFYNMDLVIEKFSLEALGDTDKFTCKLSATNCLPVVFFISGRGNKKK